MALTQAVDWRARYQALLVDLDGTLYRPTPVKVAMAAELLVFGMGVTKTLSVFRKHHEVVRAATEFDAESPYDFQLKLSAEALDQDPEVVRAVVQTWMVERPVKWLRRFARVELLRELASFQSAGGKLALVSDYPASHKARAFEHVLRFDKIVANGEQGGPARLKPHPEGYLKAAEQLGVAPAQCLVVGDRKDADGAAAEAAGMDFHHVQ